MMGDEVRDGLSYIEADVRQARLLFREIIDTLTLSPLNWRAPRQWERGCRNIREDLIRLMWAAGIGAIGSRG